MSKSICVVLILLCGLGNVKAQTDTIVFLKGKTLIADVTAVSPLGITFRSYINDKGKLVNKTKTVESYRIFSVTDNGEKSILYQQDSTMGFPKSVEDMQTFILGEQYSLNHFSTRRHFYLGLACGAAIPLIDTYRNGFFKQEPSFLPILFIPVYTIAVGPRRSKLNSNYLTDKSLLLDNNFLEGYDTITSRRKIVASAKGVSLGVALGVISYFIFSK